MISSLHDIVMGAQGMSIDIFISYARKDDQVAREVMGARGLVTSLHDRLLAVFEDLGAPRPTIFRDIQQIDKADQFEPRLGQALRETKLLLVVLSRNWLESDWCRRELDTFVRHWRDRGEDEQHVKERIVLVRKHAVRPEDRPSWLKGQSGYDLLDPENRAEVAYFDSDLGRPRDERWFTITRELATGLRRRAQDPANPASDADRPETPVAAFPQAAANGRTVFVARRAVDVDQNRATLVEELTRRGYRVLPDPAVAFPTQGDRAAEVIDKVMAEAEVSIHLLDDNPDSTPDESVPIVRLQLERAAARIPLPAGAMPPNAFHRLIWAPRVMPGSTNDTASRDPFAVLANYSALPIDAKPETALRPSDKLDGDTLTKFIQFVLQHLEDIARPAAPRLPTISMGAQIYVEHHELDTAVAEIVAESLAGLGFSPLLPTLEGDAAAQLRIHRDALQTADAVLLCWAEAADVWVRAEASELRRWQDVGRAAAFAFRSVLALPPQRPAKERLRKYPPKTDLDDVIDATSAQLTAAAFDPLLRPLRGKGP